MTISSFTPHISLFLTVLVRFILDGFTFNQVNQLVAYVEYVIPITALFFTIGHLFMADKVANSIGWQCDSKSGKTINWFQKEVAVANLLFAIVTIYYSSIYNWDGNDGNDGNHSTTNKVTIYKLICAMYNLWLGGTLGVHITSMVLDKNFNLNNILGVPTFSASSLIWSNIFLLK